MNYTQELDRTPFYYEKLTITSLAVVRLDATYRADSNAIFLTIEDASIRYRIDGGDPIVAPVDGHLVVSGDNIYIVDPHSIQNFRMIAAVDQEDAVVIATYYK